MCWLPEYSAPIRFSSAENHGGSRRASRRTPRTRNASRAATPGIDDWDCARPRLQARRQRPIAINAQHIAGGEKAIGDRMQGCRPQKFGGIIDCGRLGQGSHRGQRDPWVRRSPHDDVTAYAHRMDRHPPRIPLLAQHQSGAPKQRSAPSRPNRRAATWVPP
jgi:hypothetical protein